MGKSEGERELTTELAEVVSQDDSVDLLVSALADANTQTSLTSKLIDETVDYYERKICSLIKDMDMLVDDKHGEVE